MNKNNLDEISIQLRKEIIDTFASSRRGHLPSAFSIVEIIWVLYDSILKYRPDDPFWPDRDRFILSKGHGCLALYVVLTNKGFFSKEKLKKFCKKDGILGGHPDLGKIP
ncbi:MAG: transketolase, partial [Elusimicrobiota bacterium]|nr:transketolase [Elusimicrobiota bacterium]